MKFTVVAQGQHSVEWPQIELFVNDQSCGCAEIHEHTEATFDIDLDQEQNTIKIVYVNKQEHHTVVQDNRIVSDQSVELQYIRINDILLDSWFLTQGHYYPAYFSGFLQQVPEAPTQLKSQLIWHFPGTFVFETVPRKDQFWFWYRDNRRYIHVKTYKNKDDYREETYIGSLDPYTDLINEIKSIINV